VSDDILETGIRYDSVTLFDDTMESGYRYGIVRFSGDISQIRFVMVL